MLQNEAEGVLASNSDAARLGSNGVVDSWQDLA